MKLLKVGITHGDINGIGYEQILKVFSDPEMLELCTPVIFGDRKIAEQTSKTFESDQPLDLNTIKEPSEAIDGRINLINVCKNEPVIDWGQQTEISLQAEADSLNAAIEAYKKHEIDILVCAPGQLDNDLDNHPLSDFVRQALSSQKAEFDWIVNGSLRTLMLHPFNVTTELGEGMAIEAFMNDITAIYHMLRSDGQSLRPRMAVVSSIDKLSADIHELQEHGITIFGPFGGKDFVEKELWRHYDAVLFLEEEDSRHTLLGQADASKTYGYVAGMPLVLTYPMSGISYNIAGHGKADPTSMREAIFAAIDIYRNRKRYKEATHHPLEKQWIPKGRDDFKLDLTKEE